VTRIYSGKPAMLILFLSLFTTLVTAQQWIGVTSPSHSLAHLTISGSTTDSAEISVEIPGFYLDETITETKKLYSVSIPDGHPILEQGQPELQKLTFSLQLPSSGDLSISEVSSKYIEYNAIEILPSAGNVVRDGKTIPTEKGISYSTDAFYPLKLTDSQLPYIVRNIRAQSFQVYPLQYNPVSQVLRFYYEINIKLKNIGGEGSNPMTSSDNKIQPVEGIANTCINAPVSSLKSGQLPSDRGRMLIICPQAFIESIAPLAEWRIQTGIETEIVPAEQFQTPEEIHNYVKEYYYNSGNLAYLLLAGDSQQVPPYNLTSGSSDNFYSYLAGNDHYPDILVGRFSAESAKDMDVQVKRTIEYEKNPASGSWITTATGLASTLSPGDDGESDFQHVRNLLKTMRSTSYTEGNELFDGSQGEGDVDGNPSAADVTAKINNGTGVIFYAGHGSPNAWATGSVTKSVVESLNNNGKYPIIWSAACETGNFAGKYCLAEAWLRAANGNGQPTGAVAAVMSSGTQTSFPPMQAQDKIAELLSNPDEALSTMGAISIKGMMSMNDIYGSAGNTITDNWILFGDPSLRVRTTVPQELIVEHKGRIGTGRYSYSIRSNSTSGFVCISKGGNILGTSVIADGRAEIYLDKPAEGDNLILTVTALNYLPYISDISVIKEPGSPEFSTPLNHSRLQPINSQFSWESGDGGSPDYYLFYLGTDNPPTNMVNGQKLLTTQFKPQFNLDYEEVYFWKVVPVNSFGVAEGKIMEFRTVFAPDEDFESLTKSQLVWMDGGSQKWAKDDQQFFDGAYSLRSGLVTDNEHSSLIYPCNVTNCDFVSFWSKTSSETSDKLQFIIDGKIIGEWSGQTSWSYHSFKVDPGKHEIEWKYVKNSSLTQGNDAVWIDNIHLPVHIPAISSVIPEGNACEGSEFITSATAENYFYITWNTEGDGTFEDNNCENAVYMPGSIDNKNESTKLLMQVHGYTGCPVTEHSIFLDINPLPVITLPSDTIISEANEVYLDATISGNNIYMWDPDGYTGAAILIDSMLSVNGTKKVSLTVTSEKGCSSTKEITLHFNNPVIDDAFLIYPNPSNGNFSLKPLKGSAVIDEMTLVDREGKIVWKKQEGCTIFGDTQVSIAGMPGGTYFLVTENANNRTVNPIVIQ